MAERCLRIRGVFYQPQDDTQADSHHHHERSANVHHKLSCRNLLHLHFFRVSIRVAIGNTIAEILGTLFLGQLCVLFLLHLHDACPWVRWVERLPARLAVIVDEGWVIMFTPLLDL